MKESRKFEPKSLIQEKEEVVLIIGSNHCGIRASAFESIIKRKRYIDASNLEGGYDTVHSSNEPITTLEQIVDYVRSKNLVVTQIISLPFDRGEMLESGTPTQAIIDPKFLGNTLDSNCLLIDISESISKTKPIVSTSRTLSGYTTGGLDYMNTSKAGFRIAHLFCFKGDINSSDFVIDDACKIIVNHYMFEPKSARTLSLLASPFGVLELFGDAQTGVYVKPSK